MPILEIELVGDPPSEILPGLAWRLAEAAGNALEARPGGTWVRLRILPPTQYAESGPATAEPPTPVFVSVMKRELPLGGPDPAEVRRLTEAVAAAVGRDAQWVHVRYEPPGAGRQAFGGELV